MKKFPALKVAILIAAGILIGQYADLSVYLILGINIFLCAIAWFVIFKYRQKSIYGQFILLTVIITLGMLLITQTKLLPPDHITRFTHIREPVMIHGELIKDPVIKDDYQKWTLKTKSLTCHDTVYQTQGAILVGIYQPLASAPGYGTSVTLSGTLELPPDKRNPGGFDYRAYLERHRIYALMKVSAKDTIRIDSTNGGLFFKRELIYPVRNILLKKLRSAFKPRHHGFIQALILGERSDLTWEQKDAFARAGLIHVLAVSGLHVGFIVVALTTLFGLTRIPQILRFLLIVLGLVLYAFLTESKPPVVRAAIMVIVYLTGTFMERRSNPVNAVGIAAIMILVIHPRMLFDVGFQLSFSAILSILILYPKFYGLKSIRTLRTKINKNQILTGALSLLLVSLAAQLGTLPITLFYFNRIPLLSLLLNIIAIPLIGVIVSLTFIMLLFSGYLPWITDTFGALNHLLIDFLTTGIDRIASLPFASLTAPAPALLIICIYYILLILFLNWQQKFVRNGLIIITLFLINLHVWHLNLVNPSNKMTWIQFDVGQGDAAFIQLPRGQRVLIDCGPKSRTFDAGQRILAPFFNHQGIHQLDAIILTHPHGDHIGGAPCLLQQFDIGAVYTAGTPFETRTNKKIDSLMICKKIPHIEITAPDTLLKTRSLSAVFISPKRMLKAPPQNNSADINNQSLVLKIQYGNTTWLFMGDAEIPVEETLLSENPNLQVDVIKIGHHGSKTSSGNRFLNAVNPRYALISVAAKNRHGHPSPSIIKRIKAHHITLLQTDKHGAIKLQSDGHSVSLLQ